ncbi:cytochrome P450 [Paraphoma chrysanthemicola]|uniref:Cytochrome P450 n=1 Tax=Paraphoma chrysanthemicola TaxID=798071 RepID=A0A8K0VSA3_9PLEO|nr:cytochrome P450 [Paraphoma chrysanthemicola]
MEQLQGFISDVRWHLRIVDRTNALVVLLVFCCILHPVFTLVRNYMKARGTGLRIIVSPITPYTLQWQLSASFFRPVFEHFRWFRAIDWTCAWHDDDKLHADLGQCFILVSPGLNVLCTSDPKTIEHVLKKWREFEKPDNVNEILGTFGQNVDTSNGPDWPRHRKLTAPCFTERFSPTVWSHALSQSTSLTESWLSPPSDTHTTTTLTTDTSTLALNVISAVAFENHNVNEPGKGHTMSLREALVTVMSTSISPAIESVMPWLNKSWLRSFLPHGVKNLLLAVQEFSDYMDDLITRERAKTPTTPPSTSTSADPTVRTNLTSTLIKANESTDEKQARLSHSEVRANIFIFTVGGLESTSITLSYALALLALNPGVQDWVAEEVVCAFGDGGDAEYGRTFGKLKRVMGVMYETLRLYGPSPPLPRSSRTPGMPYTLPTSSSSSASSSSSSSSSSESASGSTITLPGSTQIMLNSWAAHTSATHFTDPKTWDPKRWISSESPPASTTTGSSADAETLLHPTSASGFLAWGSGPRVCPGMKFSQVEFCGVLGSVLAKVRVGLDTDAEVGTREWEKEKERMLGVMRDSVAEPLLLHIRKGEELRVRFSERM